MRANTVISKSLIACGSASRPAPGQKTCGDLHLVKPFPGGVLLAVVDGLGHGEEATSAARAALTVLEREAGQSLPELFQHCHRTLLRTRGAVMTAATVHGATAQLTWLGVGNVEAVLLRPGQRIPAPGARVVLQSGLLGLQLPRLRPTSLTMGPGDLLLFATDGISAGFAQGVEASDPVQQLADGILERHFKGNDDALVLAVRYLGGRDE